MVSGVSFGDRSEDALKAIECVLLIFQPSNDLLCSIIFKYLLKELVEPVEIVRFWVVR